MDLITKGIKSSVSFKRNIALARVHGLKVPKKLLIKNSSPLGVFISYFAGLDILKQDESHTFDHS